jgi:DNA-binding response OmpR family regulator
MSSKIKILVVEDEMPLAMMMIAVLTQAGCDVEAVGNGKKAIELASQRKFDLVTLDVGLPDTTGFELCSELKQRHITRNTPVIFVSAEQLPENITEGKRRGAVDYITKPFEMTDFVYRVVCHAKASREAQ